MPHVVIEGGVTLEEIRDRFAPIFQRDGEDILKVVSLFVRKELDEGLFDTLVVESGHRQHFFIQVRLREDGGATVRLLPLTDPEKTDGVKRGLAHVAAWIRGLRPEAYRFGATNIEELLDRG